MDVESFREAIAHIKLNPQPYTGGVTVEEVRDVIRGILKRAGAELVWEFADVRRWHYDPDIETVLRGACREDGLDSEHAINIHISTRRICNEAAITSAVWWLLRRLQQRLDYLYFIKERLKNVTSQTQTKGT